MRPFYFNSLKIFTFGENNSPILTLAPIMIDEIIRFNDAFVEQKKYEQYVTDKYPRKKTAIVTCMDTRLVEMLPAALGIKNGDVKMIKNAGGMIENPFDSTMRSLLIAIYELGVENIMVIGHTNCGVQGMDGNHMLHLMEQRGVDAEKIRLMENCGIDLKKWLTGFNETPCAVADSVKLISQHPLLPPGITIRGFVIDTVTGKLTEVE